MSQCSAPTHAPYFGQLSSTSCSPFSQSASVSTMEYSSSLSTVTMFVSTSLVIRTSQFRVWVTWITHFRTGPFFSSCYKSEEEQKDQVYL